MKTPSRDHRRAPGHGKQNNQLRANTGVSKRHVTLRHIGGYVRASIMDRCHPK